MRNPVRSLIWWSSRSFVQRHVLVLWTTYRVLAMQIIFAYVGCFHALCVVDGPSEVAGGPRGPVVSSAAEGKLFSPTASIDLPSLF